MRELFQNVLTASFHGSVVILAVMLLRPLMKKTPKKFLCLLWMLAFVRLLMPFEIRSDLSLQPQPEIVVTQQQIFPEEPLPDMPEETAAWDVVFPAQFPLTEPETPVSQLSQSQNLPQTAQPVPEASTAPDWRLWLPWIWLSVASCFALYCAVSYLRLKLRVREAVKIPGGWECERIETAFILGFVRPKIYIPMGMPDTVREYILAHERTHLEKGDHWVKMLGYIALALHWFNPLVWMAYILLCKDIELACDERVVQFMELSERKAYSAALLRCSSNRAHFAACPVAFGEVSVKERIMTVLHYRKPSFWLSLLGVMAIVFVAVCLVTSPMEKTAADRVEDNTQLMDGRRVVQVSDVDELLAAIGPNTVVELRPGTYRLSEAENYGAPTGTVHYTWEECYDGYQLVIQEVRNFSITGSGKFVTVLDTDPRYANVLVLRNCEDVTLKGFTAGHTTQRGECSGGVIRTENCRNVDLSGLGLYGCGVTGLIADMCTNLTLTDSDVYDCSTSALSLHAVEGMTVSNCRIYDIGTEEYGGYTFFSISGSRNVVISGCEISGSTVSYLMNTANSNVELRNNLFSDNRVRDAAFSIQGGLAVMSDDRFADNNIRRWYDGYGSFAVDPNGNPIQEFEQTGVKAEEPANPQPMLQIHVSTVDELIAAIGPNTEIILDGDFYDLSQATGYGTYKGDHYYWEDIFDGPGLVICNVQNMTIRSNDGNVKGHTISAVPRYADVLAFSSCENITLSGFTAGHTREPGSCAGGVIEFRDCDRMTVDNCGLYGCGILGVYSEYSSGITVKNCDIYECSQGGIQLRDTDTIILENNTFRDLGGEELSFPGSTNITVDGEAWSTAFAGHIQVQTTQTDKSYADDLKAMQETALDFTNAFLAGQQQTMKLHLASIYEGDMQTYEGDGSTIAPVRVVVPDNYPEDMESRAWCKASVPLERSDGAARVLTLEMCRMQGLWKVQDYYWGNGERDNLAVTVDNFVYAYFAGEPEVMKQFMVPDYSGQVKAYEGLSGTVDFLDFALAEHIPNRGVANLTTLTTGFPFRESADSSIVYHLIMELEKREGTWLVAAYSLEQRLDATVVEADPGSDLPEGISLYPIHAETYTGNVLLVEDPSRVFLGLSTRDGFSKDVPGKRIGEMLDAYSDAVAAVNAGAFYDDGTTTPAVGSYPLGLVCAEGETDWTVAPAVPAIEGFAGFNSEDKLVVLQRNLTEAEAKELDIRDGVNYGPALIIDGEICEETLVTNSGCNIRTAIGQQADGTVILMCINGRIAESLGATYADVIWEMQNFDAVNACLMHGGSASGMMYRPAGESSEPVLVNMLTAGQNQPRRLPTYWMVAGA